MYRFHSSVSLSGVFVEKSTKTATPWHGKRIILLRYASPTSKLPCAIDIFKVVSSLDIDSLSPGDLVDPYFDRFNRISGFRPVDFDCYDEVLPADDLPFGDS